MCILLYKSLSVSIGIGILAVKCCVSMHFSKTWHSSCMLPHGQRRCSSGSLPKTLFRLSAYEILGATVWKIFSCFLVCYYCSSCTLRGYSECVGFVYLFAIIKTCAVCIEYCFSLIYKSRLFSRLSALSFRA